MVLDHGHARPTVLASRRVQPLNWIAEAMYHHMAHLWSKMTSDWNPDSSPLAEAYKKPACRSRFAIHLSRI